MPGTICLVHKQRSCADRAPSRYCSNCPGPTMTLANRQSRELEARQKQREAEAEAKQPKVEKKQRPSANEQSRPAHGVGRRYILIGPCGVCSTEKKEDEVMNQPRHAPWRRHGRKIRCTLWTLQMVWRPCAPPGAVEMAAQLRGLQRAAQI